VDERLICDFIRAIRIARGLTQEQLAERCGRTAPAIVQWESGARPLSEATMALAAEGLGLSLREFLKEGLRLTER
jgi:transcriptional regulator with XRE-family HTH domain